MASQLTQVFRSKINTAIILLVVILCIGVVGFKFLNNYSWLDAMYMTVITITTVGYKEVGGVQGPESKIFTIGLILTSVVVVGYAIKVITEYIISKNDAEEFKQKKMQKLINNLSNHVIICGFGRNGKQAAKKLDAHNQPFVIIENDKAVVERYKNDKMPIIQGNANEDEVLIQAGVERASCLISALPNDADNVFVVLTARQINKDIRIISRASQESTYSKLKLAGANNVILPDKIGGDHMASLVVVPDLLEFIDNLSIVGKSDINIEQIEVEKLYNTNSIKTIKDLDLGKKTGCNVIGYKSPEGAYIVNPGADQKLEPGSKVVVLGRAEQIQKLNTMYNIN